MTSTCGFNLVATKCCGALYSTPRYSSINMSAFEYWTDGARVHSLMSTDGGLRRCKCGTFFLMKSTFNVGFEDVRTAASPEFVKDSELKGLLTIVLSPEVETVVRRRYWRLLNEPYRDLYRAYREIEDLKFQRRNRLVKKILRRFGFTKAETSNVDKFSVPTFEPSPDFCHNLECLLALVNESASQDYLEIVEILRELSRFREAEKALKLCVNDTSKTADLFRQLVVERANAPYRYRM
jgi:hypothetical protein